MSTQTYRDSDTVDFVVVGSGAAGGVIARELAQAGLTVVVMEQGPRVNPRISRHDELKDWYLGGITNDAVKNPQTFRASADEKAELQTFKPALWYGRVVGGSSLHYTANFWRFHEIDFVERSALGAIAGTGFADWPITYADLEPYYTKVEWEVGVSGLAGASPFDPPRTRPYPMPPLPVKSSGVLLERGARKLGLHPVPAPMAINSEPYRGRPACVHCGFCHGFACEVRAKASSLTTVIPEAEATGRCEVRPESYVFRSETSRQRRATGVSYFDGSRRERFQRARAVVVCANGAETPRLLLMSANAQFPDGLANSSGLVGRHLMFNTNARVLGVFEHELNEYKSVQVTRILHDFYDSDPKRGHYGGGGLDARFGPQAATWAIRNVTESAPWGSAYKARLKEFPRSMQVSSHSTSLALESNNITLDPELKDAWGLPAIRVTYKDHPDDLATARFLQDRCAEILEAAGALRVTQVPVAEQTSSAHLL
ncbi:MAG TPA: GMC family oxidoreductase N-terminal domain-containing protein, partial [Vicinamibacterales bacterium]|nr:GMC family oxidoreductase N-terminal domain-containing protein [Vicinamibacterales bacterium]